MKSHFRMLSAEYSNFILIIVDLIAKLSNFPFVSKALVTVYNNACKAILQFPLLLHITLKLIAKFGRSPRSGLVLCIEIVQFDVHHATLICRNDRIPRYIQNTYFRHAIFKNVIRLRLVLSQD